MRKITAGLMTVATAVLATGVGLGTASASSAAPAGSGTEHFYLMSTNPAANKASIIATGLFTAAGTNTAGSTFDTVRLPGGTFKIFHPSDSGGKNTLNKTTCFTTFTSNSPITLGGGTGKYKGIGGSGKATLSFIGILKRVNGQCSESAALVAGHETLTGAAKIHL